MEGKLAPGSGPGLFSPSDISQMKPPVCLVFSFILSDLSFFFKNCESGPNYDVKLAKCLALTCPEPGPGMAETMILAFKHLHQSPFQKHLDDAAAL